MRTPLLIDDDKKRICKGKGIGLILLLPFVLYVCWKRQIAEVAVGGKLLPKIVLGTAALCGNIVAGQPECNVDCADGFQLQCTWDPTCGGMCDGDYFLKANRLCPAPAPPPTAEEDLWHKVTQAQCCTCTPNMGKAMSAAIEKQMENGVEYPRMMPPINGERPEFFDDGGDVVFAPPPPARPHPPPPAYDGGDLVFAPPPPSHLEDDSSHGMQPPPPSAPPDPDFYSSTRKFRGQLQADDLFGRSVDDTYTPKAPAAPPIYPAPPFYPRSNYMEPPWPMAPDGSQPVPPDILRTRPTAPSPPTQPYEPYRRVHHNAAALAPDVGSEPIHPPKAPSELFGPSVNTKNNYVRGSSSILAHDMSVQGNTDVNAGKRARESSHGHESTHGNDATDEELHSAMNFVESLPDQV